MAPALIALALEVGAPLVRGVLEKRFGDGNAAFAERVIRAIAEGSGLTAKQVEIAAPENAAAIREGIAHAEQLMPEMIAVYAAEVEASAQLRLAEAAEPLWVRAWRPLGMYGLGFLWMWNAIVLHVANAFWKIALPPMPWDILLQLSTLYFALYMGGHTVKSVVETWRRGA